MGRRPWSNRRTVEECKSLSVSEMTRKEVLSIFKAVREMIKGESLRNT